MTLKRARDPRKVCKTHKESSLNSKKQLGLAYSPARIMCPWLLVEVAATCSHRRSPHSYLNWQNMTRNTKFVLACVRVVLTAC